MFDKIVIDVEILNLALKMLSRDDIRLVECLVANIRDLSKRNVNVQKYAVCY